MIDAELFNKVRNIMAQVIDEAAAAGITLSMGEAYQIAVERYKDEH